MAQKSPGGAGKGVARLRSSGAGPSQRGQEARTPGVVSGRSPTREEVSAGCSPPVPPRYIVEQETGQHPGAERGGGGAPDDEPPPAPGQVEADQRADTEVLGGLGGGADLGWGGGTAGGGVHSPGGTKHPSHCSGAGAEQSWEERGSGRILPSGGGRRTAARRLGQEEAQVQAPLRRLRHWAPL